MRSDWEIKKLSDIAYFNPRESIKKGQVAKKISMDQLRPYCRDINEYSVEAFSGGTKFRNGDTIMARITPCLENGKTARVSILEDEEIGFGSTEYIVFRAIEDVCNGDYLYYLVTSSIVREPAIKSMVGSSGRQRVQTDVLQNIEIAVPPIAEQRKIADILTGLDDKIAINERINNNLLQQALAIFKAWFIEHDVSEHEDWQMVTLEDITSLVTRGIAPKYSDESDQIVINQKCIRDHMLDLSPARKHTPKKVSEKWLQKGDLLINSTGQGTLGRAAQIWFSPVNMTVDSHVTIVRPRNENLIYYIGLWGILHEREIESLHTGSTGQTELPRDRVKGLELPLPDENTLDQFNSVVKPITEFIISNQNENIRLADLRDSLLPRLMSGEIDVSDIDL